METYKPQPFEDRKSQKLSFWDFTKDRLFWASLPFVTGGAAIVFGVLTKFKIFPLNGSPDIITYSYAKLSEFLAKKAGAKEGHEILEVAKDLKSGRLIDQTFEMMGLPTPEKWRKCWYNFAKGSEVALPFSAFFLWHKQEANRLQLSEVDEKIKGLKDLKPSNAELAEQNDVMRKELAFSARNNQASPISPSKDAASLWQKRVSSKEEAQAVAK